MAEDYGHTGGGKYAGSTSTAPITAPIVRMSYDQPKVSTTSGITGYSTPAVGTNAAPITSQYYNPAPAYQAPAQQQQQIYSAPAAPAAPYTPPAPIYAPGGRQEFGMFSPEQQAMTEQQWLGGDSDYTAQTGLYQKALDDFVRRITGRIEGFETDATQALAGNVKNETMSANNLGADFGARGLSYSGLFDQSKNKLLDRYKEGRGNIEKNKTTNIQNAQNEQADYTAENQISQQNARRASLLRMAAQQSLLDSQFGL